MLLQVDAEQVAIEAVVRTTGQLDRAAALVAHAVPGVHVAQILAALVLGAAGYLLEELECDRLLEELCDVERPAPLRGDAELAHPGRQQRQVALSLVAG